MKQTQLYAVLIEVLSATGGLDAVERAATHPAPQEQALRKSLRVLVAEDNAVNQKVALHQLRRLGYTADVVANGLEVLASLERIPYDVVLMDCQMPELDGYATTRKIRQREAEKHLSRVHVVAMTANAMGGDREKCLDAGMDDFITKPVRIEELGATLEREMVIRLSPPSMSDKPRSFETVNLHSLDRLRELRAPGEPDPVAEIIELFLEQTPRYLQALTRAGERRDADSLRKTAHALKGSCGNLGVERMADCCRELELMAMQGTLASAKKLVTQLEQEYVAVRKILEAECTR
jgi:CheY-like chemotaxis protein